MPELKPCPFCGGEAYYTTLSNDSNNSNVGFTFEIACKECKTTYPKRYTIKIVLSNTGELESYIDGREQAAEDWNRRFDNGKT